jgi:hypothetical protein
MLISDVFNERMQSDHGSGNYSHIYHYWAIEFAIAQTNGFSYSELETMQCEKKRQCGLCGDIAHTDAWSTSLHCINETCGMVRDYFGMSNFNRPLQARKNPRGSFFSLKLNENFGVGQVYKLDLEHRLDTCLALMLLRISMETKDE